MTPNITPSSPTRRFYRTGETLPELETEFRPIPLGRDSQGDPDGQIRAFAVSIRNRAESPIYVKEGVEGDAARVDRYESFDIYEPNGVSEVHLKGDLGGEEVEIRTVEGHNDFDVADKIDGFIRSISHFLSQSKTETTITGAETVLDIDGNVDVGTFADTVTIDDIVAASATFDVAGEVDVGTFADTVTVDDIQAGTVDVGQFADTVTIDDITATSATFDVAGTVDIDQFADTVTIDDIQAGTVDIGQINGQSLNLDANGNLVVGDIQAGSVDIDTVADTVTIDDITATSATFDGDITGQTDFDLDATTRKGQTTVERYDVSNASVGYFNSNLSQVIAEFQHKEVRTNATYDGFVERVELRVFDTSSPDAIGFQVAIDYDTTGSWNVVTPRATMRGNFARKFNGDSTFTPRFYPNGDIVIVWEPRKPVSFEAGDSVGVEIGPHGTTAGEGSADYELEVTLTDIVTK